MNSKNILTTALAAFVLLASNSFAISEDAFKATIGLIQNKQFGEAFGKIEQVRQAEPNDPEYYVLAVNYYYMKSISDGDSTGFNRDTLNLGISILKQGLNNHPNRLDMYVGIIAIFEAAGMLDEMTQFILTMLDKNNSRIDSWSWYFSKPYEGDSRQFIQNNVQSRMANLLQIGTPHTDSLSATIAQAQINYFPESVYGFANMGTLYMMQKNPDKGLTYFLDALKVSPNDGIVISNIARVFDEKGDKEKEIEYLQMLQKVGSPEEQDYAKKRIEELK